MPIVDIKSVFSGEVAFYKAVLQEERHKRKLMAALDVGSMDDFCPDIRTSDGKYADVVLYDKNQEAYCVLEFQLGFLDSIHASKIIYYLFSQGVESGVLIAEDVSEDIRDFVKDLNARGYSIGILTPLVIKDSNGSIDIEWIWRLRPTETEDDGVGTHFPRAPKLLLAQEYASANHQETLRDYNNQTLGKSVEYGKATILQMIFNSRRNSVEVAIYEKSAKNIEYCQRYENLMQEFAKNNGLEFVDTSTARKKVYRVDIPQEGSDEQQAKNTVDQYFAFQRFLNE